MASVIVAQQAARRNHGDFISCFCFPLFFLSWSIGPTKKKGRLIFLLFFRITLDRVEALKRNGSMSLKDIRHLEEIQKNNPMSEKDAKNEIKEMVGFFPLFSLAFLGVPQFSFSLF